MNRTNVIPWSNTAAAPSELRKRPEAIPDVLDALGVECDVDHVRAFIENDFIGDIIIQSEVGGWTRSSWRYHPEMQMSYWSDGDMVVWSKANEYVLADGRVMPIKCGDEIVHLAHWPICNNISRVYPHTEKLPDIPTIEKPLPWLWGDNPSPPWKWGIPEVPIVPVPPDPPVNTIPEPSTLALFLLALPFLIMAKRLLK